MAEQNQIDKTHLVIQGLLVLLDDPSTLRTKLVKLVYLADNRFYEFTGRTITGNQYRWDHYGPNAEGNTIVEAAEYLANEGEISGSAKSSRHGTVVYPYRIKDRDKVWGKVVSGLDDGEIQILRDIVRQYGHLDQDRIVSASKGTKPFANAQQYDRLQFSQNEQAIELRNKLASDPDFLEEVKLGLADADAGRWVWDEDLDLPKS